MKKLELVEIIVPDVRDEDGNLIQSEECLVIHQENLSLDNVEKDKHEKIIRKKNGEKVPTMWEKMNESERLEMWTKLRLNAYIMERESLSMKNPEKLFIVRIKE